MKQTGFLTFFICILFSAYAQIETSNDKFFLPQKKQNLTKGGVQIEFTTTTLNSIYIKSDFVPVENKGQGLGVFGIKYNYSTRLAFGLRAGVLINIPVPLELGEHFGHYNFVRIRAQNNFLGFIQEYNVNGTISIESGWHFANYSLERYEVKVDTMDVKNIKVSTKTEFVSKKSIGKQIGIYFTPLRTKRIRLKIGINYLPTIYNFSQHIFEYNDSIYLNLQFNLMLFIHRKKNN